MTRTRPLEVGAAVAAALSLTACGGAKQSEPPPTLPRSLASSLAAQSDAVAEALASGDSCRAQALARELQTRTIAAINQGRVAPRLEEQLSSAVNALAARVSCVPPPVTTIPEPPEEHGHGKHKGHHKHDQDNEGD
jgi:hypothetical protein